ncbi:MAG: ribosomal RNA small subunit methyltransferase A [Deltaproteobacteria bacterium HGW-Deltaproteobacteria-7]|jgi:16S rRNA (adenine1518-N6/adenine1519-N6)-dimethyltransferase|nr:MAG: ribosomal RNA small subunit methyltransferase A [Deltaproteobacteria bacterium HGW-Deltaproteobacteria-7]PKN52188.1 MAG: ribosomal RNA small subunit methyltransferase A [Deltaproteobacteria bacterium HGW-Deltaproteobacteria-13]
MTSPREVITHYAIKPRKNLGQSFLMEEGIIKRIAGTASVAENDIVVEIGAGIGVLTEYLAQNAAKIIAVELDDKLVDILKDRLSKYHNIEIYHGNILQFDFRAIGEGRKIKVIGNIPYNISSPVLFYLLSFREIIDSFVLMMQKEVVQRLVALPGGKEYGVPSVILQMFAAVEKVLDVPASCFYPRPKVESSVIKGFFRERPFVDLRDEEFFIKLVRDSFAQRRKMLINNLKKSKLLEYVSESLLKEALISAGIDGQRRGETLSVEEFGYLSNILKDGIEN